MKAQYVTCTSLTLGLPPVTRGVPSRALAASWALRQDQRIGGGRQGDPHHGDQAVVTGCPTHPRRSPMRSPLLRLRARASPRPTRPVRTPRRRAPTCTRLSSTVGQVKAYADRVSAPASDKGPSALMAAYAIEPVSQTGDNSWVLVVGPAKAETYPMMVTRRLLTETSHQHWSRGRLRPPARSAGSTAGPATASKRPTPPSSKATSLTGRDRMRSAVEQAPRAAPLRHPPRHALVPRPGRVFSPPIRPRAATTDARVQ